MAGNVDKALEAGRDAIQRHAWIEACDLLSAEDTAKGLSPDDLELLAQAAWWIGRLGTCIAARERAYTAFVEASARRPAALVALELVRNHFANGDSSVGSAWLHRAERLLQQEPESIEHGYLARMHAVVAFEGQKDFETAIPHTKRALDIATRFHDRDLMAIALHDQGRILVAKGQVTEGNALIDEATVAAVSGELGAFATAIVYCNTITSCKDLADYRRAGEWSEAAKRWCERQAINGFPGMCRVYRASVMRVRGEWPEAEQEAWRAYEELRDFNVSYAAESLYELGEIRLGVGDLAAAEDAFRQAHELGREPEPGRSILRLAEGKVKTAAASIRRALADDSPDRLHRAHLLPAQVEIAIAGGELEVAKTAATELEEIAKAYGVAALQARAASARGAVQLAEGDATAAVQCLRRAWHLWQEVDCPYETARTRLGLAAAYRFEGDEEAAALELKAAKATFERLGAALDVRRATGLLEAGAAAGAPRAASAPDNTATRTFMFTDIVKSTNLVEALGDTAWVDLIRWHDQTLRSLFARHGGEEIDHTGDGFFAEAKDSLPKSGSDCTRPPPHALTVHTGAKVYMRQRASRCSPKGSKL